jgi:hypothetical protein
VHVTEFRVYNDVGAPHSAFPFFICLTYSTFPRHNWTPAISYNTIEQLLRERSLAFCNMPSPPPDVQLCWEIESLPLLVLETIFEYLTAGISGRRDIFAVSLTSKRLCGAIERERYARINLALSSQEQLEGAITKWENVLSRADRHKYVRWIRISGQIWEQGQDPYNRPTALEMDEGYESDGFFQPMVLQYFGGSSPEMIMDDNSSIGEVWRSFAQLLSKFQGLKDLLWTATDQVPYYVLDILHNQLPQTRLHVHTFSLRSLYQDRDSLHDVHLGEYALATSPSLYSIFAASTFLDSEGNVDYNHEAVLEIASGLAPNLRKIGMWYQLAGNTPDLVLAMRVPRPPWRGFFARANEAPPKTKAKLTGLALRGASSIFPGRLEDWRQSVNFNTIRSLDLRVLIELLAFQTLIDMAMAGTFACLQTLLMSGSIGQAREETQDTMMVQLMTALRPLRAITLHECTSAIRQSIYDHHGLSLKKLHLSTHFTLQGLISLQKGCPNLQNLHLWLKRSQGDEQEVRFYRTLGSFSRLERLTLLLDYIDPEISANCEKYDDETERDNQVERMRLALINSAVDECLARQIFRVILRANKIAQPSIIPSFQSLKLIVDEGRWYSGYFNTVQSWVGQRWKCERRYADVHSDDVWVEEFDVQRRRWIREDLEQYLEENFMFNDDGELYRPAWEANWPESKGMSNWIDEWHSFPLWQDNGS